LLRKQFLRTQPNVAAFRETQVPMKNTRQVIVLLSCLFAISEGARLRRGLVGKRAQAADEPKFEITDATSIQEGETTECLCAAGQFWHWRIKQCIKQGPWGYECGFFPSEHHRFVCQTSLKCEILDQSKKKVQVEYVHDGAVPGSCQRCKAEDKCPADGERECLVETKLSGEACATVVVTVEHTATVNVKKEHKAEATAAHTANATAEATATETAIASKTAKGEAAGIKAEITVSEKVNVTEEASATAKVTKTATAEHTSEASAEATSTKEGLAAEKRCVGIDDVKKHLSLQDVPRLGPVLAAQVVAAGDKLAFDSAYAAAMETAKKNGVLAAESAAQALAAEKAAKDAKMAAEAKAAEEAAWKAEAGAADAAAEAAGADAAAKAKAQAAEKAAQEAKEKAASSAGSEAQAAAEGAAGVVGDMGTSDNNPENPALPTQKPDQGTPPKITEKQFAETKP